MVPPVYCLLPAYIRGRPEIGEDGVNRGDVLGEHFGFPHHHYHFQTNKRTLEWISGGTEGASPCLEDSAGRRLAGTVCDVESGGRGAVAATVLCHLWDRMNVFPMGWVGTVEGRQNPATLKGLPPQRAACLLLLSKCQFRAYILRNAFSDHLD